MADERLAGVVPPAMGCALHIEVEGRRFLVPAGQEWLIGRSPQASISLVDDRISREHARVSGSAAGWRLVDSASTNGIFHAGRRVFELAISADVEVLLGGTDGVPLRLCPVAAVGAQASPVAPGPQFSAVHPVSTALLRIGRARDCEIVVPDLLASRRHAEIRRGAGGTELVDLGSANGTYLNGRRVDAARLEPADLVTIGRHTLVFDGTSLREYVDTGQVRFAATDLAVTLPDGKRLLDGVSFTLEPNTLMAIVGPSGAGKSTLLGALTGFRPATTGHVSYGGRDLYADYDELRQRIGFVPQQDIVHQSLTVRQALGYGAELRFPADVSAGERVGRVSEVIEELSLGPQTDTRISSLSGGERKRVSTALELLTKPSLLFLDEPTSGLDTDLDRELMGRLRILADESRTVVVVTHNLQHLHRCDVVVVLARGGHVAYLGPPGDVFGYFGVDDWADLFGRLKTRPGSDWAAEHARSARAPGRLTALPDRGGTTALPPLRQQPVWKQFATLCRRYLAVTASDRALLAILVLLPALLAVFARAVLAPDGLSDAGVPNTGARQLLVVLVVGAALMGAASAVREMVKERAIYRRERAVGLSSVAYVGSKVLVLGTVAAIQGVVLTVLALVGRPLPVEASMFGSPLLEFILAVAGVSAVSAVLGLVISAAVRDENQAMPLLVVVTMAQLVLCGGLVPVEGRVVLAQLSWLLPARWGFAATASTADLNGLEAGVSAPDPRWEHSAGVWITDVSGLALIGASAVVVLALLVRRLDPVRR